MFTDLFAMFHAVGTEPDNLPKRSRDSAVPAISTNEKDHGWIEKREYRLQTITGKKADYVIALKGKQPGLLEDAALYFESFEKEIPVISTNEKDHGRIEKREYRLQTNLSWLPEQKLDWVKSCRSCKVNCYKGWRHIH